MKSRILCGHHYHTVEFHDDGTVTSTGARGKAGCGDITSASRGLGATIMLGRQTQQGGCAALAALVNHGIPHFLLRDPGADGYLTLAGWDRIYMRFESNKVVEETMAETRRKRDAAHVDTFSQARKAFSKCKYHEVYDVKLDQKLQFMPEAHMAEGKIVALGLNSVWTVPLQKGWVESISKAGISVVGGKLICGIDENNPRRVWAIDQEPHGASYSVQAFELQTKPRKALLRGAA